MVGVVIQNASSDSMLNPRMASANSASDFTFALGAPVGYPSTINANNSLTLNTSGNAVLKLSGRSQLTGIILATNRSVNISVSSNVTGEVIAQKVSISGRSGVTLRRSSARKGES